MLLGIEERDKMIVKHLGYLKYLSILVIPILKSQPFYIVTYLHLVNGNSKQKVQDQLGTLAHSYR